MSHFWACNLYIYVCIPCRLNQSKTKQFPIRANLINAILTKIKSQNCMRIDWSPLFLPIYLPHLNRNPKKRGGGVGGDHAQCRHGFTNAGSVLDGGLALPPPLPPMHRAIDPRYTAVSRKKFWSIFNPRMFEGNAFLSSLPLRPRGRKIYTGRGITDDIHA